MTSSSNTFEQLRDFLKAMFQFGDNDLDFGIYRITRLKRKFIETFIDGEGDNSLRAIVTRALNVAPGMPAVAIRSCISCFGAGDFLDIAVCPCRRIAPR